MTLYFNEKYLEERLIAVEQIQRSLNDPLVKLYFYFLDWILPKFSNLNKYFQSEKNIILSLHQIMEQNFRELLLCYMQHNYVTSRPLDAIDPLNRSYFCQKSSLYLGIQVLNLIETPEIKSQPNLLEQFQNRCIDFLSTACSEIKKRYDFDKAALFATLNILLPENAVALEYHNTVPTLLPLLSQLVRLADKSTWQEIDDEWRKLPFQQKVSLPPINQEVVQFWGTLLQLKNDADQFIFRHLAQFVLNVLSLPHSNAECERVFSQINLIKTKIRNKTSVYTINGTLLASQHVKDKGSCTNFTPEHKMLQLHAKSMYSNIEDHDFSL